MFAKVPVSMFTRFRTLNSLSVLAFAGMIGGSSFACTESHDTASAASISQPKGTDRIRPEYDAAGKLQKLEYDRNNDGKVDT